MAICVLGCGTVERPPAARPPTPASEPEPPAAPHPGRPDLPEGLRALEGAADADAGLALVEPSDRHRVPVAVGWDGDAVSWVAGVRAVHWRPNTGEVALKDAGLLIEPADLEEVGVARSGVVYWTGADQHGLGSTIWRRVGETNHPLLSPTVHPLACRADRCVAASFTPRSERSPPPPMWVRFRWHEADGNPVFVEEVAATRSGPARLRHIALDDSRWYAAFESTLLVASLDGSAKAREVNVDSPIRGLGVSPMGVVVLRGDAVDLLDPETGAVRRSISLDRPLRERLPVRGAHLAVSADGRHAAVAFRRGFAPADQGVELVDLETGARCPFAEGARVDALAFGPPGRLVTASREQVRLRRLPSCE